MTEFNVGDIVKSYRLQGEKGLVGIVTEDNSHLGIASICYKVEWLNPRIGHSRWGHTYGYFGAANLRKAQ